MSIGSIYRYLPLSIRMNGVKVTCEVGLDMITCVSDVSLLKVSERTHVLRE